MALCRHRKGYWQGDGQGAQDRALQPQGLRQEGLPLQVLQCTSPSTGTVMLKKLFMFTLFMLLAVWPVLSRWPSPLRCEGTLRLYLHPVMGRCNLAPLINMRSDAGCLPARSQRLTFCLLLQDRALLLRSRQGQVRAGLAATAQLPRCGAILSDS